MKLPNAISKHRLIKALGEEKALALLREINEKAPSPRMGRLFRPPLKRQEIIQLSQALKCHSIKEMETALNVSKPSLAWSKFARLAHCYLLNHHNIEVAQNLSTEETTTYFDGK